MKKRIIFITLMVFMLTMAEFFLYNMFGPWFKPELVLLAVIFCTLYWGVRYGIGAGFLAGCLKDSLSIDDVWVNILIYVAAAYLTTFIRRNFYQPGSRLSRVIVVFSVVLFTFLMRVAIYLRSHDLDLSQSVAYILVPQWITTLVVVTWLFVRLKEIVVKFRIA